MKTLYLVRHAKSSWKNPSLADFERPLNKRGKRDAPLMGKKLHEAGIKPGVIISSTAVRAFKTAKIIAMEIDFSTKRINKKESIYLADVPTLIKVIRKIGDKTEQAMLFGHNPGLTMLANYLTNESVENIPTCGVFCIDFEINSWKEVGQGSGKMVFFGYPKKHS
jgi:phosphohistidine phosphatase